MYSLFFYCVQVAKIARIELDLKQNRLIISLIIKGIYPKDNKLMLTAHTAMKKVFNPLFRLFIRFRYPVSTPEDVASDLGLDISNYLTFQEFMSCLTNPCYRPRRLIKFMPRNLAEEMFQTALRKERFQQYSHFSYYFKGGWMEFMLQFDEQSRLRRLYIRHKDLKQKYEISISQ